MLLTGELVLVATGAIAVEASASDADHVDADVTALPAESEGMSELNPSSNHDSEVTSHHDVRTASHHDAYVASRIDTNIPSHLAENHAADNTNVADTCVIANSHHLRPDDVTNHDAAAVSSSASEGRTEPYVSATASESAPDSSTVDASFVTAASNGSPARMHPSVANEVL